MRLSSKGLHVKVFEKERGQGVQNKAVVHGRTEMLTTLATVTQVSSKPCSGACPPHAHVVSRVRLVALARVHALVVQQPVLGTPRPGGLVAQQHGGGAHAEQKVGDLPVRWVPGVRKGEKRR